MAPKLTIRRVGTIIPTICLVVFLILCIAIVWLSTVGVPEFVVRDVEEKIGAVGIPIRIEKIRLDPGKGISFLAEGVHIYTDSEKKQALSTLASASITLDTMELLTGSIIVESVNFQNGNIRLPVTEPSGKNNVLEATGINISAKINKGIVILTGGDLKLQGIPIHIQGGFDIAELQKGKTAEEETEKVVLPALIKTCQSVIDRVYHMIEQQQWSNNEFPELHLKVLAMEDLRLHILASVPKYDIEQFHFRDTLLDLDYEGDRLLINNLKFSTVSDDNEHVATGSIQAGYEIETRKLSFKLDSDVALIYMVTALTEGDTHELLKKFRHESNNFPHIDLHGAIEFEQDFTLRNVDISGNLEQRKLWIGDAAVESAGLSFFYKNGKFNINNLNLRFPDGHITISAKHLEGEQERGDASLQAELPIIRTITLINEFLEEPLTMPIGLDVGKVVKIDASAEFEMQKFLPGQSYLSHIIPTFSNIDISLSLEKLSFAQQQLIQPNFRFICKSPIWNADASFSTADNALLSIKAAAINVDRPEVGKINLEDTEITLNLADINLNSDQICAEAEAEVKSRILRTGWGEATNAHLHLTVSEPAWAASADILKEAAIQLSADSYNYHDTQFRNITLQSTYPAAKQAKDLISPQTLTLSCTDIVHHDIPLGALALKAGADGQAPEQVEISFTPHGVTTDDKILSIKANRKLSDDGVLTLSDIDMNLPLAAAQNMLSCLGLTTEMVKLPEQARLKGCVQLNLADAKLRHLTADVEIPELVRTPTKIIAYKGKEIPFGIQAKITADTATEHGLSYAADLTLTHSTGKLTAHATVNTDAKTVHVTADSTIRADVIDAAIDMEDAYSILRDFAFTKDSKCNLKNAVVEVDYANGLSVNVNCDIDLRNAQYQLNGVLVDDKGKESHNPAMGKLPFVKVNEASVHLQAERKEGIIIDGKEQPKVNVITMKNVTLVYDNRPWLNLQNFSALGIKKPTKHTTSTLKGNSVIIDVEHGVLKLKGVKGSVYPAYSIGMFYGDLREHLADVLLPYPVDLSTESCVIPIYKESKAHMDGHIRVVSNQLCGFRFLGTTIPFTRFNGFINLEDEYIFLDRMNARCWNGTLDAAVKIGITGDKTSFDGQVYAQNMDLQKIAAAYGSKMDKALCSGNIRFRSPSPNVNDIEAYGSIRVVNGDLLSLSLFRPIGALVSDVPANLREIEASVKKNKTDNVLKKFRRTTGSALNAVGSGIQAIPGYNHLFAYDLQDAFVDYTIKNGKFTTTKFKSEGYNLKVTGLLSIDLNSLEIYGNMWPEISSLPTVLLSPITFLSDFMLDIVIYGKIDDIQWKFKLDSRIGGKSPVTATSATRANNHKPRKAAAQKKR